MKGCDMQDNQAIDLYSGVGGWSLGLRLAGIDVIASYEISDAANTTNHCNNGHAVHSVDIRSLDSRELPATTFLVGSPPCTQFSTSNRGGSGDFLDGLRDVARFLEIVDELKPKAWAMENVPRLQAILAAELREGGQLEKFVHLGIKFRTFDLQKFGVPQRRRRCIAGNIDFDLLESYADNAPFVTLGDVIDSLHHHVVKDPNFSDELNEAYLLDHDIEESLSEEEIRINKSSKVLHPIYNTMQFPDPLDRPVRTITATCTRVSRESIVIESPENSNKFRRLSVRERACAQGFPIAYQFFGKSHSQKLKMIGNAMPPIFAYYVGHALRGTPKSDVLPTSKMCSGVNCSARPNITVPHKVGAKFPKNRTFRFAIPTLRLGSGVRFELSNRGSGGKILWHVRLIYGTSKDIRTFIPLPKDASVILKKFPKMLSSKLSILIEEIDEYLLKVDVGNLQAVWGHSGPGLTRPFILLDHIDKFALSARDLITSHFNNMELDLAEILTATITDTEDCRTSKLRNHAPIIVSGLIVASRANAALLRRQNAKFVVLNEDVRIAAV
jgi:DNA (cytosine-5)-methyltransferase 1